MGTPDREGMTESRASIPKEAQTVRYQFPISKVSRWRFLYLILLAALASCSNASRDGDGTRVADGASIAGVVREANTEVPVAAVSVFLVRTSDRPQIRTNTDADGRFSLEGLEPGRHLVALVRDGYVVPGRLEIAGYPFTVTSGQQIKDAEFHLVPAGTISGHVLKDDGTPANRVEIQLLQQLYVLGRLQWSIVNRGGSARTTRVESNERGEFRALGVDPGQYAIRFVPHEDTVDAIVPGGRSLAPAMYPGVRDISTATLVEVKPGRETLLDDVKLPRERRGWIRVSVFNETGQSLEDFGDWKAAPPGWVGGNYPLIEQRVVNNFHEFQPDVRGGYDIRALWPSPIGPLAGTLRISFQGVDINTRITLKKPHGSLTGRVTLRGEDGANDSPLAGVELSIGPEIPYFARSGSDGMLSLPAVYPGEYQLGAVRGLPENTYVFNVSQGTRDVLKENLSIQGESTVDIVIASGAGTAEGRVVDDQGKPVHNALVALVPDMDLKRRVDYYGAYAEIYTDQNGAFTLRGLTPGAYQAYAWMDAPAGGFRNEDFMKRYSGRGTPLTVGKGSVITLSLTALP